MVRHEISLIYANGVRTCPCSRDICDIGVEVEDGSDRIRIADTVSTIDTAIRRH